VGAVAVGFPVPGPRQPGWEATLLLQGALESPESGPIRRLQEAGVATPVRVTREGGAQGSFLAIYAPAREGDLDTVQEILAAAPAALEGADLESLRSRIAGRFQVTHLSSPDRARHLALREIWGLVPETVVETAAGLRVSSLEGLRGLADEVASGPHAIGRIVPQENPEP
jgi:hypothetical protein